MIRDQDIRDLSSLRQAYAGKFVGFLLFEIYQNRLPTVLLHVARRDQAAADSAERKSHTVTVATRVPVRLDAEVR